MNFSGIHRSLIKKDLKKIIQQLHEKPGHSACISGRFKMKNDVEIGDYLNFSKNLCDLKYLDEFPVEDSDTLTYSEFFEKYLFKNQACLVRNVSTHWKSSKFWVKNNFPDFCYLSSVYGDRDVTVEECKKDADYLQKSGKPKWKFRDYMKYWEENINNCYPENVPLYYLKDWHLQNESPDDNFYEVPLHFASDWTNEYLVENCKDDYRFIYMGIKGTWSPFHVDVMTSHSWSSNICGLKRWVLFPPGEEEHLRDKLGNLPRDIEHLSRNRKCFEVLQYPGDAIFVPSNWHHQVWNLKDTISVNHNWINGCNLKYIWLSMAENLSQIKNEIKDCDDMENFLDHCQIMLHALFSLDFREFYNFMLYIACKRINFVETGHVIDLPENRRLGKNHALFDLWSIQNTLKLFVEHEDTEHISDLRNAEIPPKTLMKNIQTALNKRN